jgi:hypothetical protein
MKTSVRGQTIRPLLAEEFRGLEPHARIGPQATVTTECRGSVYRARYYDPIRSRFVSEDPIGLAGGLHAFAYAANIIRCHVVHVVVVSSLRDPHYACVAALPRCVLILRPATLHHGRGREARPSLPRLPGSSCRRPQAPTPGRDSGRPEPGGSGHGAHRVSTC